MPHRSTNEYSYLLPPQVHACIHVLHMRVRNFMGKNRGSKHCKMVDIFKQLHAKKKELNDKIIIKLLYRVITALLPFGIGNLISCGVIKQWPCERFSTYVAIRKVQLTS